MLLRLLTAALLAGFTPSALLSSEYKDNFDNGAEKGVKAMLSWLVQLSAFAETGRRPGCNSARVRYGVILVQTDGMGCRQQTDDLPFHGAFP